MTAGPAGVQPEPPVAAGIFGDRIDVARRYATLLTGPGTQWGLIGPREAPRIWDRHLLGSAVLAELVPPGASVVDVGSGAGLPGLPLALARPDLSVVLLEPMARRVRFLDLCAAELGLDRVTVLRSRAEQQAGRVVADVTVSRALAELGLLAARCAPLTRPGGLLLAVKGASATAELAAARPRLPPDLARSADVRRCGVGLLPVPTTVVRMVRARGSTR